MGVGATIGEGSFAKVKHVGKFVEKTSKRQKGYEMHEFVDEVCILKLLQSKYVPVLYDYSIYHDDRVRIKMSYAGIDLKVFYKNICTADKERYLKDHCIQICKGLQFMHSMHIVHCDIKPKNILLQNGCIKIIDFNLSQFEEAINNEFSVYPWPYRPLEVINKRRLSCKSDLYALGMMMFYLKFNIGPLYMYKEDKPPNRQLHLEILNQFKVMLVENCFNDPILDQCVKWCCEDLSNRCTATEVLAMFNANSHKRIKKTVEPCEAEPFDNSYSELIAIFKEFKIPQDLFDLVFLTCWFTWSNLNFDKDSVRLMVFLIIKMLLRGNYPVIQKIEKLVEMDLTYLKESVYLSDYAFLLTANDHYRLLKDSDCHSIFRKLGNDFGLELIDLIECEP